jgi:hypothetical protein
MRDHSVDFDSQSLLGNIVEHLEGPKGVERILLPKFVKAFGWQTANPGQDKNSRSSPRRLHNQAHVIVNDDAQMTTNTQV